MSCVYYLGERIERITSGGDKYMAEVLGYLERNVDLVYCDPTACGWARGGVRFGVSAKALLTVGRSNVWAMGRLRRARKGDIVLINAYFKQQFLLAPWVARYLKGCGVVLIVNALSYYSRGSRVLDWLDRMVMKAFLHPATVVIANDGATKKDLAGIGISSDRMAVASRRLDLPPDPAFPVRKEDAEFSVLTVGKCVPRGQTQVLLEALGRLRDLPLHVHIVGEADPEGEYVSRLRHMISEMRIEDRVTFHGRLDGVSLSAAYLRAHVFVDAAQTGGLRRVAIEAMHFGLPVVVVDQGGDEDLMSDGVTGLKFKAGDAADLADKILRLYRDEDLLRKMGREARERSKRANFDHDTGEQVFQIMKGRGLLAD